VTSELLRQKMTQHTAEKLFFLTFLDFKNKILIKFH